MRLNVEHASFAFRGTNSAVLTVSTLPAMGFRRRFDYVVRYPHALSNDKCCLPQPYLAKVIDLDKKST
jgi:hypothetical protein